MIGGHGGNVYELARRLGCRPEDIDDLSSNVNPLGPPPGLLAHLAAQMAAVTRLPEVDNRGLLAAAAPWLGVAAERLLAAGGTTQFIYALPRLLAARRVLIAAPTYSDYADACRLAGVAARSCVADESRGFQPDPAALEAALRREGADTLVICNPNNPTGALVPAEEIRRLARRNAGVRFVVDESYLPFVPGGEAESLAAAGLENVLALVSVSKIYCISGLRLGFLAAPAAFVKRAAAQLLPWSVNSLAQAAVAWLAANAAAVAAFVAQTQRYLEAERRAFRERLAGVPGLTVFPGSASFLLIRLPQALGAAEVAARFAAERLLIRPAANFEGLSERFIRISPKGAAVNRRAADLLRALAAGPERR